MRFLTSLTLLTLSTLGMISAAPTVYSRQSLTDFFDTTVNSKDKIDLFYLAIDRMQKATYTDKQSWFALAAIHGNPIVYDGVAITNPPARNTQGYGYCSHGDPIFPTWHRPYLSALENAIIANAKAVINSIPISSSFTAAQQQAGLDLAATLRLPYWDWERKIAGQSNATRLAQTLSIPAVLEATSYTTTKWIPKTITPNPLKSYTAPADKTLLPYGISSTGGYTTDRAKDSRRATFYVDSLRDDVSVILASPNWLDISNHRTATSIESIHDSIHGYVGGSMGYVPTAAFDPIFWFHHNNVDRITAIYQATQTSSWVPAVSTSTQAVKQVSLTSKIGDFVNATSPLWPFRWGAYDQIQPSGQTTTNTKTFVTSNDIRDVKTWGYTYPELEYIKKNNLVPGSQAFNTYINGLFPIDSWKSPGANGGNRRLLATTSSIPNAINWRIVFETFPINYFGGSVEIRVFLNSPSASAATPIDDTNLAASIGTFSMNTMLDEQRIVSVSITNSINRLKLATGTTVKPNVNFQNIQVVITGPAVQTWLSTATQAQLAQLKKDIANDVFSPKIKEFAIYEDTNGQSSRLIKRYIGVPVSISIAADGVATSVVSGSVKTLEIDMSDDATIDPSSTTETTTSSSLNLPVVIGAAVGGVVLLTAIVAIVIVTKRRRSANKSNVHAIEMDYTQNPAIQQL